MRNIEIFYHFFIVPDARAVMWPWFLDQQLGLIQTSKLATISNTNICITMPRYWNEMFGIRLRLANGTFCSFEEKVREYIELRYPWATIVDIRDVGLENISEAHTLRFLYKKAVDAEQPFDVLYFNNKGAVSGFTPEVYEWRKLLDRYMIEKWPTCLKLLAESDVVGVSDKKSGIAVTSGNFWWSKSEYVSTLTDPLEINNWASPTMQPGKHEFRYSCELWIMQGNRKYTTVYHTDKDHYVDFMNEF